MKIIRLFLCGIVLSLILLSCGGGAANTPDGVAKAFLEHINNLNFDEAKKLATEEGKETLDLIKFSMEMLEEEEYEQQKQESQNKTVEIISVEEQGDTAVVTYKTNGTQQELEMVKENGQWKVDFQKEM